MNTDTLYHETQWVILQRCLYPLSDDPQFTRSPDERQRLIEHQQFHENRFCELSGDVIIE